MFKRGQHVNTPDGIGRIVDIENEFGRVPRYSIKFPWGKFAIKFYWKNELSLDMKKTIPKFND